MPELIAEFLLRTPHRDQNIKNTDHLPNYMRFKIWHAKHKQDAERSWAINQMDPDIGTWL
jgi:hypothetical protein